MGSDRPLTSDFLTANISSDYPPQLRLGNIEVVQAIAYLNVLKKLPQISQKRCCKPCTCKNKAQ